MVLLAAAVCTKGGKPLVSRQFVEMTRSRIEGILTAFPKLMTSDKSSSQKQHTFVETDSVRYVYQPIDQLYVVLVTTKNSNILEDLETLRLFSRVIPEYCRNMEEKEILDNAFQLIFAFDEIVALGYRESVNLAQIRTFTDMDSHEERVYYQIKKSQEEEAKKYARDKARELTKAKLEAAKKGIRTAPVIGGYGSQSAKFEPAAVGAVDLSTEFKKTYTPPSKTTGPSKALRLGAKTKDVDTFVDQLKSEGQDIASFTRNSKPDLTTMAPSAVSNVKLENVHIKIEENLTLSMSRDGKIKDFEVKGLLTLRISDENLTKVKLRVENNDKTEARLQAHPDLNKKAFQTENMLMAKSESKPFSVNKDMGVLKWRFFTDKDDSLVPLSINCWPSESGNGCDVNIEFTLENENLELNNVVITIPLPTSVSPVVGDYVGDYRYDRARNQLEWKLPIIDKHNKQGTLEFTTGTGHADNFFPVKVQFSSNQQFCDIKISEVLHMNNDSPVKFSQESIFKVDNFEIV